MPLTYKINSTFNSYLAITTVRVIIQNNQWLAIIQIRSLRTIRRGYKEAKQGVQ